MTWRGLWNVVWVGGMLACGVEGGDADTTADGGQMTAATSSTPTDPTTAGDPTATAGGVCEPDMHSGEGTYYGADGSGNCSFDAAPGDPLVAAMNDADYAASAACGACVELTGPDATIVVRIVDRCPECPVGDIDLGEAAFTMVAAKELGRVPISWRYVSCPVDGPLRFRFKEGSSQWWTAVQVRNHRNAIAGFEYRADGGAWKSVPRFDYNYFIDEAGMGPGPLDFRVTDVEGNVVEELGIPLGDATEVAGTAQFPACGG